MKEDIEWENERKRNKNNTSYTNVEDLKITTLENVIFMKMKNDISCVLDMKLQLYEHQSTVNPNMPLRFLRYVNDIYEALTVNSDIYSKKLIKIPTPSFIIFYNGSEPQPERKFFLLSEAFEIPDESPALEVVVLQLNINEGFNEELKQRCPTLCQYMQYVDKVRKYLKNLSLEDAVVKAVDECIEEDILREFLLKNRSEAIHMSIYEFNEKLHEKSIKECAFEEGHAAGLTEGHAAGLTEGEFRKLISQVITLISDKKAPEFIYSIMIDYLKQDKDIINNIFTAAEKYAPEYDVDKIYEELIKS